MEKKKNIIIDYGMGNLYSIQRAINAVGEQAEISDDPTKIRSADRLILPGVGAFGNAMAQLGERRLLDTIYEYVDSGKPLLGICLGMQLLLSQSSEFGTHAGLGFIKGEVRMFDHTAGDDFKIPQIGWNKISVPKDIPIEKNGRFWNDTILAGVDNGSCFYFVHSFVCFPDDRKNVVAETFYGRDKFCSVVNSGNVWGCQFHPERSGAKALRIYKNFFALERS